MKILFHWENTLWSKLLLNILDFSHSLILISLFLFSLGINMSTQTDVINYRTWSRYSTNNLYIISQKSHHSPQKEGRVVFSNTKIKSLENIYLNQKNKFQYSQIINVTNRLIISIIFEKGCICPFLWIQVYSKVIKCLKFALITPLLYIKKLNSHELIRYMDQF